MIVLSDQRASSKLYIPGDASSATTRVSFTFRL